MRRGLQAIRTLRWKLTLSASITMMLAVVLMTAIMVVQWSLADQKLIRDSEIRAPLQHEASDLARQLRPVLQRADAAHAVERWLADRRRFCDLGIITEMRTKDDQLRQVLVPLSSLAVADAGGRVLAAMPAGRHVPGASLPAEGVDPTRSIRGSQRGSTTLSTAPITSSDGDVLGFIYLEADTGPMMLSTLARRVAAMLRQTVARAAPFTVVVALVLGALSTRGLTRRLKRLSRASSAWARGDFSLRLDDASGDELGALARSLDDMALRFSTLLDARKELAALEERNFLARELHDTVKQKVFSVSMLLGSVEALAKADPEQARACLAQARTAAHEAGRELTALIEELRPAVLERWSLPSALREHVRTWSGTQQIRTAIDVPSDHRYAHDVEANLLRVAQEALTNVARHSRATSIQVQLQELPDEGTAGARVRLTVRDDGVGFDPARRAHAGFGLESMATRMRSLGGSLHIESSEEGGTTVVAECVASLDRKPVRSVSRDQAA